MTFGKSYPPVKARRPKSRTATHPDLWLRSGAPPNRAHERAMIALGMPPEILDAFRANGLEVVTPGLAAYLILSGKQNPETIEAALATTVRDDTEHIAAYSRADNEVLLVRFVPESAGQNS